MNPIKTSHGIAILGTCFLLSLLFINWAGKQIDSIALYIPAGSQTAQVVSSLPDGLVAHYTFDDTANDSAGTNNGTVSGGASYVDGKIGRAMQFDGVDDYVTFGTPATLNFGAGTPWTFSHWAKWDGAASGYVLYAGPLSVSSLFFMRQGGIYNNFGFRNTALTYIDFAPSSPYFKKWVYLTWVADSSNNITLYINGAGPITKAVTSSAMIFKAIGQANGTSPGYNYSGSLDDVRIYNRALSQAEIADLYNYQPSSNPPPTTYSLSVQTNGTGSGTITCDGASCPTSVNSGTPITFTANINSGSSFAGWAGTCSGTVNTCSITVNSNLSVTATFNIIPMSLPLSLPSGDIISSDQRIDWQAGVPGGIPNYPIGVNVKDYGAVGDGVTDDYLAVMNAIAATPNGKAVYFPEGTYKLSQTIVIKKPQSIVLRGAGPTKTKLIGYSNTGAVIRISYDYAGGVTHNVTGGMIKESNSITLDSVSSLNVGDYIRIQQSNDPAVIQGNIHLDQPWQGQIFRITGINGNAVTTDRPLYYTYSSAFSPTIRQLANMTTGSGVEDLFVEMRGTGLYNIYMYYAAKSWVKNVESYNSKNSSIKLTDVYQGEIRDNYVHDHLLYQGYEYGVQLDTLTTDTLVENNSIQGGSTVVMVQGGATGNVVAYNYSVYGFNIGYPNNQNLTAGVEFHGDNPNMNLVEGNVVMQIAGDDTWGSSRSNTFFRNWATTFAYINYNNVLARWGLTAAKADALNYYYNFVGNILTRPGDTSPSHVAWNIGRSDWANKEAPSNPVADSQVEATILKHGNFDYISNTTQWDPNISNHNLPPSLYLSGKPIWFGSVPFPPIGPDVSGYTNKIPAQVCFERGQMPNCLSDGLPSTNPTPADLNHDGKVNTDDLKLLTGDWNKTNSPHDLNHDGIVNSLDYVIMVQGWTG